MVKRFKVRGFYISFNGYKVGRWKVLRDQKTPILNLMFLYLNFSYFWCPLTIRLAQRPEVPKAARRAGAPPHLLTLRGEWTRRSNEWRMERVTPDETSEAGTTWGFLTFLLLAVSCRSPSSGSSCLHSSSHLPSGRHEGTEWSEPERPTWGRDEEWGERREMNGEPRNRMNEARLSYLSPLVRLVTVRLTLVSFLSPRVLLSFRAGGEDERRDEGTEREA